MDVKRSGWRRARANGALVTFILKYVVALQKVRFSLVVEATGTKISATGETPPPAAAPRTSPPIRRRWKVGRHQRLGLRRRLESAGRVVEVERGDCWFKERMPHNEGFCIVFFIGITIVFLSKYACQDILDFGGAAV